MIVEDRKQFGQMLRESRKAAGLTLRGLAERAGIQFSNIWAIESGRIIAGAKQAAKLADGLGLKGRKRENLLLAASLSSRRTNPGLEGAPANAIFFRALPWLLKRLGLKGLGGSPIINLCKFAELPPAHPPLVVVFEHPSLNSGINHSRILKPNTKKYLRENPEKHFLALIVRKDGSQTLLECGATVLI